jgi:alpha-D-xyloside xylohydrolase
MSFIPYLYAAFNEYRLTGMPPVRAMVMDWPDDPHTFEIDNQFMFGPSIMVAPILTGQKQRKVYLPHGTWYDLSTQRRLDGGRWITVSLPPEEVPMFVKAGTLLPIARPVEYITPETCFDITLYAFGSSPASITLYEDDGVTLDYKRGRQNRLTITWAHGRSELQRHGNYHGPVRYRITGHKQV